MLSDATQYNFAVQLEQYEAATILDSRFATHDNPRHAKSKTPFLDGRDVERLSFVLRDSRFVEL